MGEVFVRDRLIPAEISEHRSARVHENAEADGEILVSFERDELVRWFSVVEDAEVFEFEIVHGDAVEVCGVEGEADLVDGDVEGVGISGGRLGLRWLCEREVERARCSEQYAEMDGFVEDGVPVGLGRLEVLFVTNGHAGWSFDGFGGDEFGGVAVEVVDAVDEGGAVNGFGGVAERGGGGPLLEDVVDVRAGYGAGLTAGGGIDGQAEHGFEAAELRRRARPRRTWCGRLRGGWRWFSRRLRGCSRREGEDGGVACGTGRGGWRGRGRGGPRG